MYAYKENSNMSHILNEECTRTMCGTNVVFFKELNRRRKGKLCKRCARITGVRVVTRRKRDKAMDTHTVWIKKLDEIHHNFPLQKYNRYDLVREFVNKMKKKHNIETVAEKK